MFMLRSKCFHCDSKFHSSISICADKLIVLQFDYISVFIRNGSCNTYKLTGFIRKKYRYSEDSVSENKSLLNH